MEKVFEYLKNEINIKDKDTIVLGNSGGPDSMCLLHILSSFRKTTKINIVCAHVNHNVRKKSASESHFLEEYCKENDLIFETMIIEKYGDDNFQNQARKIRYNFFEDLIKKYNANYLMTAHHGDDLIETILMRIVRGSTVKGYSGFNKNISFANYQLIRPLIFVTKEEILRYNEINDVPYVIDNSNFKSKYTRNRYRNKILPFLKKEEKRVHEKFIKFSENLEEYDNYFNNVIRNILPKVYNENKLVLEEYKKLDKVIQKKIIFSILEGLYNEELTIINDKHVKIIEELIISSKPNSRIFLPNGIEAIKTYNFLEFSREIKDIVDYELEFNTYAELPNGNRLEKVEFSEKNDNNICRIDSSEVELPLYVRTRREGDKMLLKKVNGYKKLKDIFIDSKVELDERDKCPVVVDSKGEIIWLPGLKKSKFTKLKTEKYDIIIKYD